MQQLLDDRNAALSGEDRFTSLMAQDQYARELRWIEPLSQEQEAAYFARLRRGKQEQEKAIPDQWRLRLAYHARLALFHAYLPFVNAIAIKLWSQMNRKGDLMDLIQTGNRALLETLRCCTFEHGRASFRSYLAKKVKGEMFGSLSERHLIRIPPVTRQRMVKQGREHDLLCLQNTVSLEHLSEGKEGSPHDLFEAPALILSPPAGCSPEKSHLLALLLAELPVREQEVMRYRYGLHADEIAYSRQETADLLGRSERTVQDCEQMALVRLRNLVTEYEQKTGQTATRWLDGDEGLCAYLDQRRREKAAVPSATKTVNTHLHQAYTAMQQAGEKITCKTLAQRASVCEGTASKYLRSQPGHLPRSQELQEIQGRLEQAYTAMQQAGEPITGTMLGRRAGIDKTTAMLYLKKRGAHMGYASGLQEIQGRLEQACTSMRQAGEKITGTTLAQRAGVSPTTARKYLRISQATQEKGA